VLGAAHASVLVVRIGDDLAVVPASDVKVAPVESIDPTRRVARLAVEGVSVDDSNIIVGGAAAAIALARTFAAAEAAGGAAAALKMALDYAKVREQFGRTIGTFQAVKHHLANMAVDAELAGAVAWDAARSAGRGEQGRLAAAGAAAQALPAFKRCAEKNIQILGGIGFTWEHDAHLYLRRAWAPLLFADESLADHLICSMEDFTVGRHTHDRIVARARALWEAHGSPPATGERCYQPSRTAYQSPITMTTPMATSETRLGVKYGYTINSLEEQQAQLYDQRANLEVTSARLQSLDRVAASEVAKNLAVVAPSGTVQ
jgi:hypothetical protein